MEQHADRAQRKQRRLEQLRRLKDRTGNATAPQIEWIFAEPTRKKRAGSFMDDLTRNAKASELFWSSVERIGTYAHYEAETKGSPVVYNLTAALEDEGHMYSEQSVRTNMENALKANKEGTS